MRVYDFADTGPERLRVYRLLSPREERPKRATLAPALDVWDYLRRHLADQLHRPIPPPVVLLAPDDPELHWSDLATGRSWYLCLRTPGWSWFAFGIHKGVHALGGQPAWHIPPRVLPWWHPLVACPCVPRLLADRPYEIGWTLERGARGGWRIAREGL